MDDYEPAVAADFQSKNPDGSNKPEPAFGLWNARFVCTTPRGDWRLWLFGTNLTNEWYVNGGFDLGTAWGHAPALIGRPRQVGSACLSPRIDVPELRAVTEVGRRRGLPRVRVARARCRRCR